MILSGRALIDAVSRHLDPGIAEALQPPASFDDTELPDIFGPVFGRALIEAPLRTVRLSCGFDHLDIGPSDAAVHPLIGAWSSFTLGEALAAPVRSGALAYYLAAGSPKYGQVKLIARQGAAAGVATLNFAPGTTMTALYGEDIATPFATAFELDGSVLTTVGILARKTSNEVVRSNCAVFGRPSRPDLH